MEHETLGSRVDRAMCGDEYLSSRLRSRVSVDLGNSGLARLHHNYLSGQAMYNETAGGSALFGFFNFSLNRVYSKYPRTQAFRVASQSSGARAAATGAQNTT